MSGCVIFKSTSSTQLNIIGGVQITSTICASDNSSDNTGYNPADPSCQGSTHGGNNGEAVDSGIQLLIAYRIPTTVTAPASFTSSNTSNPPTTACGGGITFTQDSGYSSQLTSNSPPGSGKQWVGYISTQQSYTNAGCQYVTVSPTFTITQGNSNPPFQGPFNYRVVVGERTADGSHLSSRAVTCNADITKNADSGVCADDPNTATIATDVSQTTRDLGVVPTNTSVHAGATATVPFNLKYAGAAGASVSVSAGTDVPSATATPSITTLTPTADSNNNMTASVPVPAGTTPGTYHVTVTATGTGFTAGQNRSGTATLTVGQNFTFDTAPALPALGTIALNAGAQSTTAQMNNFSVNDTGSTHTGWNVTVAGDGSGSNSAVFREYCPGGACGTAGYNFSGQALSANSLTLNSTGASWTGGTGSAPTFQCGGGSCPIDSATPTKIASAANGSSGTGLWSTTGFTSSSVSLATPSTLRVLPSNEQYRLNVVWTLNNGP